jgi:hypothetical protein
MHEFRGTKEIPDMTQFHWRVETEMGRPIAVEKRYSLQRRPPFSPVQPFLRPIAYSCIEARCFEIAIRILPRT